MSVIEKYNVQDQAFAVLLEKLPYAPGEIVSEYHNMLKQSRYNVADLSNILRYMANENLGIVEDKIKEVQGNMSDLNQLRSEIKVTAANTKKEKDLASKDKPAQPVRNFTTYVDSVERAKKNAPASSDKPVRNFSTYLDILEKAKKNTSPSQEKRVYNFTKYLDSLEKAKKSQAKSNLTKQEAAPNTTFSNYDYDGLAKREAEKKKLQQQQEQQRERERQRAQAEAAAAKPKASKGAHYGFADVTWLAEGGQSAFVYSDIISSDDINCAGVKNEYGRVSTFAKCVQLWFTNLLKNSQYSQYAKGYISAVVQGAPAEAARIRMIRIAF